MGKVYADAAATINDKYMPMPMLVKASGKPEAIPDQNFATAGKNLQTMIASYDALRKTLFTDTGGKLFATVLRKQEALATWPTASTTPILYILNHDAALTTGPERVPPPFSSLPPT